MLVLAKKYNYIEGEAICTLLFVHLYIYICMPEKGICMHVFHLKRPGFAGAFLQP